MKNHKEMFEALLAGETLVSSAKGTNEYKIIEDRIHYRNVKEATAWCKCNGMPNFDSVEVKPKTININGFEVPEPLRVAPDARTPVYIVSIRGMNKYIQHDWISTVEEMDLLDRGLVHKTPEAATLHSEALLSFTKKE